MPRPDDLKPMAITPPDQQTNKLAYDAWQKTGGTAYEYPILLGMSLETARANEPYASTPAVLAFVDSERPGSPDQPESTKIAPPAGTLWFTHPGGNWAAPYYLADSDKHAWWRSFNYILTKTEGG